MRIVIIILLVAFIESYLTYSFYKSQLETHEYVSLPPFFFYWGIALSIIIVLPIIGKIGTNPQFYFDIGFWLTVALDLALIIMAIAQVHWRIYPNDTDMVHVNIFRMHRTYRYDQIKYIKKLKRLGDTIIKIDGKLLPIVIDKYAFGLEEFIRKYNRYKLSKSPK